MSEDQAIVVVIDDDVSIRESVEDLLGWVGLEVKSCATSREFLQQKLPDAPGCIVLDVRLPGGSGLEFQKILLTSKIQLPIIFIGGHSDIPTCVKAMKSGAVDFLTKPLREQELLDAVQMGIERDRVRRREDKIIAELRGRLNSL